MLSAAFTSLSSEENGCKSEWPLGVLYYLLKIQEHKYIIIMNNFARTMT